MDSKDYRFCVGCRYRKPVVKLRDPFGKSVREGGWFCTYPRDNVPLSWGIEVDMKPVSVTYVDCPVWEAGEMDVS